MIKKKRSPLGPEILMVCEAAQEDLSTAIANPIWQLLFIEDSKFAGNLPNEFKLLLLKSIYSMWGGLSVPDDLLEDESEEERIFAVHQALESLDDISVDVDPWKTEWPGVSYLDSDQDLEKSIDIGCEWSLDVLFSNCDIEMKDVNYGCDERVALRQWLEAFFADSAMDIRAFAKEYGLSYEPGMSPECGSHFRFSGIRLSSLSGNVIELEACDLDNFFEINRELAHLLEAQSGVLQVNQIQPLACFSKCQQPIFDGVPEVDSDTSEYSDAFEWYSPEGRIYLKWKCNCWLPLPRGTSSGSEQSTCADLYHFVKKPIEITFNAHGNDEGSYEIVYSYKHVGDAKGEILKSLDNDRLDTLYQYALGLPVSQAE